MAYTKYSLTPANNTAAPPDGAPEGMLPSAVNDTMRDMMSQIRDVGDGVRDGTYTMTAPKITGGTITGVTLTGNTLTNPVITGATLTTSAFNGTVGATTASTGAFTTLSTSSTTTLSGLTASTALALDASKNVVSVTNTGTGNNVLSASPTLTGTIAGASLSLSSLTSGRVTYAGASGLLSDSANLQFTGTKLLIGTSTAAAPLTVITSVTSDNLVYLQNTNTSNGTSLGLTLAAGTNASDYSLKILNAAASSEFLRVTGAGNVGIGTSSPSKLLDVNGDALINGLTVGRGAGAVASNTVVGFSAGAADTTGSDNTYIGAQAGLVSTGSTNTAVGSATLGRNAVSTSGANNTALGGYSLTYLTTGANNVALGSQSLFSNTTASDNTAVGYQAGYSNTGASNSFFGFQSGFSNTGTLNTFTGPYAGYSNTSGNFNTFDGAFAGYGTTTGANNVAVGQAALQSNTTASNNTAVGYQAGYSNTTGSLTTVGYLAGYSNSTGTDNSSFGSFSLRYTTTGAGNSGYGAYSLTNNTTGSSNTAVGMQALQANTTASNNTAVGYQSLYANTTGSPNTAVGANTLSANTTGSYNIALSQYALASNTTGGGNIGIGYAALFSNTTASNNTAVGYQAGYSATSGGYNTFIGQTAGYSTTGAGNTFVGGTASSVGAGYFVTTGQNNTIIGGYHGNSNGLDIRTASNYIVLSDGAGNPRAYVDNSAQFNINVNSGTRYTNFLFNNATLTKAQMYWDDTNTNLYVQCASGGVYLTNTGTSWTSNSDERLKENLVPIENGLSKVCSLRSVIGNFIADETKKSTPFLIAQDVQMVLPEAVTISTIKGDETNTEYLGVAYTEVIPLLVAAIKELKAEFDAYKATHP